MTDKQDKESKPKRGRGRPPKRVVKPIPDTPENIAKALFGIPSDNPELAELRAKNS